MYIQFFMVIIITILKILKYTNVESLKWAALDQNWPSSKAFSVAVQIKIFTFDMWWVHYFILIVSYQPTLNTLAATDTAV